MPKIFVSHSSRDAPLLEALVDLLRLGCDAPRSEILATSLEGSDIAPGKAFEEYLKRELQDEDRLVVQLLTPAFYESSWCMAEAGAAWALDLESFPLLVPPLTVDDARSVLEGKVFASLDDDGALSKLNDTVRRVLSIEPATEVWNNELKQFRDKVAELRQAGSLSGFSLVAAAEYESTRDALRSLRQAIERSTFASPVDYEEDIEHIYMVGVDGDDRMIWKHTTRVQAGALPWRRITADADAAAPSVADMRFEATLSDGTKLTSARVAELAEEVAYAIFFKPWITADHPVEWSASFRWPSFWDTLRRDGRDFILLPVDRPGTYRVRVVFPEEWPAGGSFLHMSAGTGARDDHREYGRSLVWDLGRVEGGRHRADIEAPQSANRHAT